LLRNEPFIRKHTGYAKKLRFLQMTGAPTHIIQGEDGSRIAINEYGDAQGAPVFFCHGWPSSRMMAMITEDAARDLGVRIISPDRPGINESAFQTERKLLDWPRTLQQLATELGIEKFRVLGISGGAPYAFASAWALPQQVEAIAVVSGAPPISELTEHDGLLRLYRWMLTLYRTRPQLLQKCFYLARPFASMRMPIRFRPMLLKLLQP
jgi:pimeloyl-ACP methyl ester carboxylesterase